MADDWNPDRLLLISSRERGGLAYVRKAVQCGADPLKARDGHCRDMTALMNAAKAGALESIQFLLPLSDANAVDEAGRPALFLAIESHHPAAAALLAGATDPGLRDSQGKNALDWLESQSAGAEFDSPGWNQLRAALTSAQERAALAAQCPAAESREPGSARGPRI